MKTVSILGSTGSIGHSTVDLIKQDPKNYDVKVLVGGKNAKKLAQQVKELNVQRAVIADENAYPELKSLLKGTNIDVACGRENVCESAAIPVDWTMAAITGAAGLEPTLRAIENGNEIALANKEALVCAGHIMLEAVQKAGATLLPVDSEHNAVFQSMADGQRKHVCRIILTASGGPFRNSTLEEMRKATVKDALKHPTWSMGAKISIDSATMFNKGLEIIEAARLFSMSEEKIGVYIHPQSVVHGMAQYDDGSLIAQMGSADMRIPIANTLAWPKRMRTNSQQLDLGDIGSLEFYRPDDTRFPAISLARRSLREGGASSTILSAANEIAVAAFLNENIGFLDIASVVKKTMDKLGAPEIKTLDSVIHWDHQARDVAHQFVTSI